MRARVFVVVCLSFALAGCGGKVLASSSKSTSDTSAANPVDDPDAGTPSATDPFAVGDDWVGTYLCEGGPAKLDLHIVAMHDDAVVDALFQFDPDGVKGSYH